MTSNQYTVLLSYVHFLVLNNIDDKYRRMWPVMNQYTNQYTQKANKKNNQINMASHESIHESYTRKQIPDDKSHVNDKQTNKYR